MEAFRKFDLAADALDSLNDVRARLAENNEDDGCFPVEIARVADVRRGIDDLGYIGKADGGPVVVTDDERRVVSGVRYLSVGKDIGGGRTVRDLTAREIRILDAEDGLDARQSKSIAVELRGIDLNPHRRLCAAAYNYLPDSLDLRELLLDDCRGRVIHGRPIVDIGCEPNDHDRRICRVHFSIGRIPRKVCRQIRAGCIDGGFNIAGRSIDVTVQIELQRDLTCCRVSWTRSSRSLRRCAPTAAPGE